MTKYARSTLEVLAATIREIERKADEAGRERDRLLAEAREAAQERSGLMMQATNLREILSGADSKYYATYVSMFGEPFDPNAESTREQFSDALRDVAAYLESTPQLPIGERGHITIKTTGSTPAEQRADLDRIAEIMGVEVKEAVSYSNSTMYAASLDFGPVYLYASVNVPNEPQPEAPGGVLDEGMTGMGEAAANADPAADRGPQHAEHAESDAERGICQACGASIFDGYCSNPQAAAQDGQAVSES